MKRNKGIWSNSIIAALAVVLFFVNSTRAQDPFVVKWTMDYTQAGTSDHTNFTPANAALLGGPNTYALPTVYSAGGAIVVGYVVRPWPVSFTGARYMEFSFNANSFKYNISSISFRLRRSGNGPNQIKVRTNIDAFASDLGAYTISNSGQFNTYTIPVSYNNLSNNTFTLRIYGYNSVDIYGTLWFDEIKINGQVLAIILPIDLTYLKAVREDDDQVTLSWETAWENNSKEFVIERGKGPADFTEAGTVPASGQTSGRVTYRYLDPSPLPGTSYYRLRLTDRDGTFRISKSVAVTMPEKPDILKVFPNPASARQICISVGDNSLGTFLLSTFSGNSIPFQMVRKGADFVELYPSSPLTSGFYLLSYMKNGRKEQVKVLVP
nr:hypothetical protein [uncultured Dyadobacter sp.]